MIDITGQKRHMLTAIKPTDKRTQQKLVIWECVCDCGETTFVSSNNFGRTQSCGCILAKNGLSSQKDFAYVVGDVLTDEKRNITITSAFRKNRKRYCYKCNVCSYNGEISEYDLLHNKGCPVCANKKVIVGYNDISTTRPDLVPIIGNEIAVSHTRGSKQIVKATCPDCGTSKEIKICDLSAHGFACTCGDGKSYPEKFMYSVLNQLDINFVWGFSPKWLIGYQGSKYKAEFDFFIPEKGIVLEIDGGLGHGLSVHSKSDKTKEDTLDKDIWKDTQATLNGIKVVRIPATSSTLSFMTESIKNTFGVYYNLDKVSWVNCDEHATKNVVKEVCEYFEKNKPISSRDLEKVFPYCYETILRYLRKGKDLGWCDYDLKERLAVGSSKLSRPINIYLGDKYINTYKSANELHRRSVDDFGVQLHQAAIWRVLTGKNTNHKGYTFKYKNTN